MGKIRVAQVVGGLVAVGALAAVVAGGVVAVTSANAPDAEPATAFALDYGADYDRLSAVSAASADRDARAAEATRSAAEAAAAEEARLAAEQQAAEELTASEEPPAEEPADDGGGGVPATWIDLGNGTGMWDFSHCPTQSGSTGPDGGVYCN